MASSRRFLLYSHDGMGFGHTRRNLAIAAGIRDLDDTAAILVACSIHEANRLGLPPGVELLQLPAVRKVANESYVARNLGISADEIRELRAELMAVTVRKFRPHVLLVDKHPLGICGELIPALNALKATGGHAVLGLRPILDDPEVVRREWTAHGLPGRIAEYYDRVLVYGQPHVFDPVSTYDFPPKVAARSRFCGYVANRVDVMARADDWLDLASMRRPIVLAAAGGGEDGRQLLASFIEAVVEAPWQGIVVTGTMMPEPDRRALLRLASKAGVAFYPFVAGLARWFAEVDAVVCMGGYNTVVEALSRGVPIVCVPRVEPRVEQLMRARAFARLKMLQVLEPRDLSPAKLRAEIELALGQSRPELRRRIARTLDFEGARHAATHLVELSRVRTVHDLEMLPV